MELKAEQRHGESEERACERLLERFPCSAHQGAFQRISRGAALLARGDGTDRGASRRGGRETCRGVRRGGGGARGGGGGGGLPAPPSPSRSPHPPTGPDFGGVAPGAGVKWTAARTLD